MEEEAAAPARETYADGSAADKWVTERKRGTQAVSWIMLMAVLGAAAPHTQQHCWLPSLQHSSPYSGWGSSTLDGPEHTPLGDRKQQPLLLFITF